MPLAVGKRGVEEGVNDLQRKARADNARAEREDVGVVVLTGRLGGEAVPAERSADTGTITDETTGAVFHAQPFPAFIQEIINDGGLVARTKRVLAAKKGE